jgi:hypothetical protein
MGAAPASASTTVVRVNQSPTGASGSNLFTYPVTSLEVNATYPQAAQITASTTPGTYYVWVITDNTGSAGQSTANQANDIVMVGSFTVTSSTGTPDLQVSSSSLNPASVSAGGTVTATWAIRNAGTASANASSTILRVNQSSTSASGSNLFTYAVTSLAVNATYPQAAQITASTTAGSYYVWVITDNTGSAGQSTEGQANDTVMVGSFTVATSTGSPDLQVSSSSVAPASASAGGTVTATWAIRNAGTAPANASTTVVRVNQSPTSAAGSNLFTYSVTGLAVNATYPQAAQVTASMTSGAYYVWVIADNTGSAGQSTTNQTNDIVMIGSFSITAATIPATPAGPSPGSTSSPGPTTSGTSVGLSWSGVTGATSYSFGVRDTGTGELVVDVTDYTSTSYTAHLSAGRQYRWNVSACNSAGCSTYTAPLYFQTPAAVTIPATPAGPSPGSTSSPGPTTSGTSVGLSWSGVTGATSYSFGVRDAGTGELVVDVTDYTSTSYTAHLSAGRQYRWNVSACNSAGCSTYTAPLYFRTP